MVEMLLREAPFYRGRDAYSLSLLADETEDEHLSL